ncbi:MAG: DNA polymerase III subunit chi [Rhabdochlamydiaceae bacterium]
MNTKVVFLPVKTTSAKLIRITDIAAAHFQKGEPILFLVQDEAAWEFLDKLLWSTPAESFLPHPSKLIHIRHNLDDALGSVFNLCPAPLLKESIKTLYELEDHTSPEKLKASQERYHTYRSHELQIIVEG